jgi:alpha-tubulin suppressor-like RCC1 family protein
MSSENPYKTGYVDENGVDLGNQFVEKEYFFKVYDSLVPWATNPGLFTWGAGASGVLGDGGTSSRSTPAQTLTGTNDWRQVDATFSHVAAIKTNGTLWIWGNGANGGLGDNSTISKSSPVQTISGGTNWRQVSVGQCFTTAIKTDGTLWTWGVNNVGQLGNNSTLPRSSPVQTISGGTNWRQVSAGIHYTAAIKTDGTLWLWGCGSSGILGNNSTIPQSSPVQTISGGTDWKEVSAGQTHTSAIKTDGTLWSWGAGFSGALGNNTTGNRLSPVQTISGGTDWKSVSVGIGYTGAIKTDGTLWLWGCSTAGRLGANWTTLDDEGDPVVNNQSSPVQTISGGNTWRQISAGDNFAAAIKNDGTLWTWGCGASGRLGNNATSDRASPVQTVPIRNTWKQVSAADNHSAAILETGDY